jgi:hypothetical protein
MSLRPCRLFVTCFATSGLNMTNKHAFDRRCVILSGLMSTLAGGIGRFARAEPSDKAMNRNLLRHEKTIPLQDTAWRYALSPDARSIALLGYPSGKVFIVEIATGRATEVEIPDIRIKNLICWSRDGKRLAIAAGGVLIVASVAPASNSTS